MQSKPILKVLVIAFLVPGLAVWAAWWFRDRERNPCHIADWGAYNGDKRVYRTSYDHCYGVEDDRLLMLINHMLEYTPPGRDFSAAEEFDTDVNVRIWWRKSGVIVLVNGKITPTSPKTIECKDKIHGVEVTLNRWETVNVTFHNRLHKQDSIHVTDARDSCLVQLMLDKYTFAPY